MFASIGNAWRNWRKEVRENKAIKKYHKLLDQKADRGWWDRVTKKDYTQEHLEKIFKFTQEDRQEHEKFWKDYHGSEVKTERDQKEVTSHRYAMQQTIAVLLKLVSAEEEPLKHKSYRAAMDIMYRTSYYAYQVKMNREPVPAEGFGDLAPSVLHAF